jgi:hypothetical protein
MATYYWVGGNGTWDVATTTNWASTSGGAGGAGVPTAADDVIFNASSGAAPVVTVTAGVCRDCTIGAPTSGTLTLAFGASTLTLARNYVCNTTISVTGTGTINLTGNSTFSGGGNTYHNVSFTFSVLYACAVNGANTFNNLSFPSPSAARAPYCAFGANQTINGTLTCTTPGTGVRRMQLRSDLVGTRRTLTCAAVAALTDVDFQDIEIAGAAAPVSGTRLGNCLNNIGVTFDAPKTVYWNLAAGGNVNAAAWATSSGGAVATTNFPLAQDTAIIEDTGLNSGATITHTIPLQYGNWDSSSRTLPWNFSINGEGFNLYGSLKLANCTLSGTSSINAVNNGTTIDIQSGGATFTQRFFFFAYGGTVNFTDAFTCTNTGGFALFGGTLKLKNGATTSIRAFTTSGTNQKFLQSTVDGSQATLSQVSGTVNTTYLTIKDINATGGATWQAFTTNNNVDAGNNLGWDFSTQLGRYIYTRRKNKRILP